MYKIPFYLLLCLAWQLTNAQVRISTLKDSTADGGSYSFPLIHPLQTNPARQINSALQLRILENTNVETDPPKAFVNTKYIGTDSIHQSGYTMINYSVLMNSPRVLSLAFEFETMGAYPDDHRDYFSFNLQTGALITMKELFTTEGCRYLSKYLAEERKKRVKEFLASEKPPAEDVAFLKELYEECINYPDEDNILIQPHSILFPKASCVPHAWRPYDTNLDIEISINELKRHLTDAGRKLLL